MTDLEIMQILTSDVSIFEKGQAFRKAIDAMKPSALNVKAIKERKPRSINKPKATSVVVDHPIMNGHDHEAHS